jgi:CubicO group peptidase (beta-lactamase class C family)
MIRRSLLSWALFLPAPLAAQSGRLAGLDAYITRAIWGSTRTRRMARRIRLLLRHGDRPSGRVFSEAASHEMRSPQTIIPLAPHSLQARRRPCSPPTAWGGHCTTTGVAASPRTADGRTGMLSRVALVPSEHLGLVVLTNIRNRDIGPSSCSSSRSPEAA